MKKTLSKVLSLALCLLIAVGYSIPASFAAEGDEPESYAGKTIVIYTGNLRGDIDHYDELKTAKADFAAKGAEAVYLVDAGNYLQGRTYANSDRGLSVYNLMDAAGYDVAAMGAYEFVYGEATTGQKYHSNLTKYHTQKMLYKGQEEKTYNRNMPGTVTATLAAKDPAGFKVISSNIEGTSAAPINGAVQTEGATEQLYAFVENAVLGADDGLKIGFIALTAGDVPDLLEDDYFSGLSYKETVEAPEADVIIALNNESNDNVEAADCTINAVAGGDKVIGAVAITPGEGEEKATVEPLDFDIEGFQGDADVAAEISSVKDGSLEVLATSEVTFVGKNSLNRSRETTLGDLVADSLYWYATSGKIEGFKNDVPVVAIQNGGNVRESLHSGDITEADLFYSYPYSPAGIGVLYVTGEELLESLEEAMYQESTVGFPHVAGMTYNIDLEEEYDASTTIAYGEDGVKNYDGNGQMGSYYYADSYNRVSITSIGGKAFDPKARYAVVADAMVAFNGLDMYKTFQAAYRRGTEGTDWINNGNGILTRNVVAQYLQEGQNGEVDSKYAEPQGRVTFGDSNYKKAKAAMEDAKAGNDAAKYLAAAKAMAKEAAITGNQEKIREADDAVEDAKSKSDAADLAAAKNKAKKELGKVDLKKYKEPELSKVKKAIADGKKKIDAAKTIKAVNTAKAAALNSIGKQAKYNSKLPKVTAANPAKAKKAFTAKWKKLSKANRNKVTGIEIQYALDKKFTKSAKIVKAKKTAKSKKINKLAKKKTYWVRVRTYKTKNGVKTVGNWSTAKKVTTK